MSSLGRRFLNLFDVLEQVKAQNASESQTEFSRSAGSLWATVREADLKSLESLLDSAADKGKYLLSTRGPEGELPLHMAFLYNTEEHKKLGRFIISRFPEMIAETYTGMEYNGENILHIAIINQDYSLVNELIQIDRKLLYSRAVGKFFSKGRPCYYGEYPIFFAACTNQYEIVELLMKYGADLNVVDSNGNTILHLLIIHNMMEMYKFIKSIWIKTYRNTNNNSDSKDKESATTTTATTALKRDSSADNGSSGIESALFSITEGNGAENPVPVPEVVDPKKIPITGKNRLRAKVQSSKFKEAAKLQKEDEDGKENELNYHQNQNNNSPSSSASVNNNFSSLSIKRPYFEYIPASASIEPWSRLNRDKLTPVTLSAQLGNFDVFSSLLDENKQMQWTYGPVSCYLVPLEQIDTPIENEEQVHNNNNESNNNNSLTASNSSSKSIVGLGALELIIHEAHLHLLMHPRILDLIQRKWDKFASGIFFHRFLWVLLYLLCFNATTIMRQSFNNNQSMNYNYNNNMNNNNNSINNNIDNIDNNIISTDEYFNSTSILNNGYNIGVLDNFDGFLYELLINPSNWNNIIMKYPTLLYLGELFVLIGASWKGYKEWKEMYLGGIKEYFHSSGSAFLENILSLSFVILILLANISSALDSSIEPIFMSFASIFGWLYLFFFLLAFRLTGPMIVMLAHMIYGDLMRFLMIYSVFCMGFSLSFYVLFNEYGFIGFISSLKKIFLATLGKFELDEYLLIPKYKFLSILYLILFVIIVTILLLNLLIAMMGDTYGNINEQAEQQWHLERARIIFSIEHELTSEERNSELYRYWTNIDGKRFLQVLVTDSQHFPRLAAEEEKKEKEELAAAKRRM